MRNGDKLKDWAIEIMEAANADDEPYGVFVVELERLGLFCAPGEPSIACTILELMNEIGLTWVNAWLLNSALAFSPQDLSQPAQRLIVGMRVAKDLPTYAFMKVNDTLIEVEPGHNPVEAVLEEAALSDGSDNPLPLQDLEALRKSTEIDRVGYLMDCIEAAFSSFNAQVVLINDSDDVAMGDQLQAHPAFRRG